MAATTETKDSLKRFDAYRDENGQSMGQDSPTDLARPDDLQRILDGEPNGEAETARLASGRKNEDATAETEAEISAETLARLSDPKV